MWCLIWWHLMELAQPGPPVNVFPWEREFWFWRGLSFVFDSTGQFHVECSSSRVPNTLSNKKKKYMRTKTVLSEAELSGRTWLRHGTRQTIIIIPHNNRNLLSSWNPLYQTEFNVLNFKSSSVHLPQPKPNWKWRRPPFLQFGSCLFWTKAYRIYRNFTTPGSPSVANKEK